MNSGNQVSQIEKWWKSERWENVLRDYSAADVACLRNSFSSQVPNQSISNLMAKKLFTLLKQSQVENKFVNTFGALDPIQVTNLAKYLQTVYVSGWQCSSTASVTNQPGPDFADYPMNTVPNKVDQLVKAQMFHDRKQNYILSQMSETEKVKTSVVDYMQPIIADADTGFGGVTSTMKLTQLMIDAGAACIHLEDQRSGTKKCGHMGGKVLVPTREHIARIKAARLQADIMDSELMILARTDALSARLLDNNIDPVDQPHILGISKGKEMTFVEAGFNAISEMKLTDSEKQNLSKNWVQRTRVCTLDTAHKISKDLGFTFEFDWEVLRTEEGFYRVKGSVEFCASRANEYLKYADMIWMETPTPNIPTAKKFSDYVRPQHPKKFLSYNLSPSFNWDSTKMTDEQFGNFCQELGNLGYVWQFITLAGFHMNALISEKFSKEFSENKILAYIQTIQREERKYNVDQLKHQKWSGADIIDRQVVLVNPDLNVLSGGADSTELQFENGSKPKL